MFYAGINVVLDPEDMQNFDELTLISVLELIRMKVETDVGNSRKLQEALECHDDDY